MDDPDRDAVYLCEDRVAQMCRVAAPVTVTGGAILRPEPDHRFATLAEAGLFCTVTCLELGLPPVTVRRRAGDRQSHYSPASATRPAEIALASWGASRLVVVHELAHHLVHHRHDGSLVHGPEFRQALLELLRHLSLTGQARALEHSYRSAGLR